MRGWCGVARDSSRAKRARSARARRLRARTHAVRHHSRVSARHLGCPDPAPGDTIAQRAPSQPSPSPVPQSPCRVLSSAEKRPGSRQDIRQPLNVRRNTDERKRQKRRRVVRCGVRWWSVQTPPFARNRPASLQLSHRNLTSVRDPGPWPRRTLSIRADKTCSEPVRRNEYWSWTNSVPAHSCFHRAFALHSSVNQDMKQHTKSRRPFDPATRACLLYAGSQAESRCSAIRKFKTDVNGCPLR